MHKKARDKEKESKTEREMVVCTSKVSMKSMTAAMRSMLVFGWKKWHPPNI